MRCCIRKFVCCAVVMALLPVGLAAQAAEPKKPVGKAAPKASAEKPAEQPAAKPPEKAAEKPAAASDRPAVHKVAKGPFKIEISLKGVFEAETASEIVLRPQAWKTFEVRKAVEPGATVEKGDVLVEFEAKDIDEAISDLRSSQRLADLALKQAEENLRFLEAATPLDLAAAERAKRLADEDLDRYLKVNRSMTEKGANFQVESAENHLRYEKEELAQLEKMYKADDLTEETEEIVLKRQRDAVRRAEFSLEDARWLRDQVLEVRMPRDDVNTRQTAVRQDLATAKNLATSPLALGQQRLELEKLKQDRAKSEDKLKKLLADRDAMTLRAPIDGVVYYGQCVRGKWSGGDAAAKNLRYGASVPANDAFMTVVKPRPMFVRVSVSEKEIRLVRPDVEGSVEPAAYPGKRIRATVTKVEPTASAENSEARLAVELRKTAKLVMPGMSCNVKLVPYRRSDALTVPVAAVFTDDLDEPETYVYRVTEDGKHKRQKVSVGQRTEERVEIVKGLREGDQVLLERPKEKP